MFDEELMAEIVRAGTWIGITHSGPQQAAAKAGTPYDELPQALRDRFETLQEMRHMGTKIVLHSDAIAPITCYEDFPYTIAAAVRYGGFSPVEAVHAATGRAADAIDILDDTGTLTPGKDADILVVDGDVATDIEALARTRAVLRDGQFVAGYRTVRTTDSHI
jgi:imidazolonepropionase-like amidohydrolase